MYKVHLSRKADKFLKKIKDQSLKKRILKSLIMLGDDPESVIHEKIKRLSEPTYRIKIGTYRLIYSVDHHDRIVRVLDIRKRNETTYR